MQVGQEPMGVAIQHSLITLERFDGQGVGQMTFADAVGPQTSTFSWRAIKYTWPSLE